jgi:membrane-bound lytic murein transglycosylase A
MVDRRLHTARRVLHLGYLPIEGLKPDTWFKRLMIAQDTGGAIVGPARADLYFGAGDEAASVAGRLRHYGKFVMLVPKALLPAADDEIPLPRPRPANLMSDETAPGETPEAKPAATNPESKETAPETCREDQAEPEKADADRKPAAKKAEKPAKTKPRRRASTSPN